MPRVRCSRASSTNARATSLSRGSRSGRSAARMTRRTGARSQGASPATAVRTALLAARRGLDAGHAVFGVRDALVVHAEEQHAERVLGLLHVAEGQVAFVELS